MQQTGLGSLKLEDKNIAFVIVPSNKQGKSDAEKAVGAYIPKVMSEIDMGDKPWTKKKQVRSNMIQNNNLKIEFQPTIVTRNFYNVIPLRTSNTDQPSLNKGENFWVNFLDGDLKKGRYESKMMDESKRTTDRHRVFIKSKASVDGPDKEYDFVMDSEQQIIALHMDGGRGEVDEYTVEINGKSGTISLKDTKGNKLYLNTKASEVGLVNSSGSKMNVVGGTANIISGTINLTADSINTSTRINQGGGFNDKQ